MPWHPGRVHEPGLMTPATRSRLEDLLAGDGTELGTAGVEQVRRFVRVSGHVMSCWSR